MNLPLQYLLRPRSVAVIGASRRRGTIGGEIFHNLIAAGFQGAVYPVNAHAPFVQSVRAYPTIGDVPDPVDLAVIAIPHEAVLDTVDACAAAGVRALVVVSSGFAETGAAGAALQTELLRRVRAHGMRLVGPNCLGVLNTDPEVRLDATFAPTWPPSGTVAFSSQSGAFGLAILDYARDLGIGVSQFVSVGNKADVSGNDLLEAWEADPRTHVILLYLESFGNPARFLSIARRVSRTKPIAVVKAGRTSAGARAAGSHTGALASVDAVVDGLLAQAGVVRADTIEELFDLAMLLANQPVPAGPRIGIVTNAGGPGIMTADACEGRGLEVPALTAETQRLLRTFLPADGSAQNPVDLIASARPEDYERAIRAVLDDPGIDALIVLFVPPVMTAAADIATAIRRATSDARKPVASCLMGTHGVPVALSSLREGHLPSYRFPEAAAIALSRALRYGELRSRPEGRVPKIPGISTERARAVVGGQGSADENGRWLQPDEVREVLAAYGLQTPRTTFVADGDLVPAAAEELGFPVAVKLVSDTIQHKTEVGGVVLGARDAKEAGEAYSRIRARLVELGRVEEMKGVTIQEMIPSGVETLVGATRDPAFGALVAFGVGGIQVELLRDVVFRVCPVTDVDAKEMLERIRSVKLLDGFRGRPAADRPALVDAILRVSQLMGELAEVDELDLNPLVSPGPDRGVVAVDARIRVRGRSAPTRAART